MTRIQSQGLGKLLRSLGEPSHLGQRHAEVEMRVGGVGLQPHRLGKVRICLFRATGASEFQRQR